MHRRLMFLAVAAAALVPLAGCNNVATRFRERPQLAASLDSQTRGQIERGIVEPGFTPQMVYLALGKPTSPFRVDIDSTRDGTWVYRQLPQNERDFVRSGFRRRVVFDPVRRSDVIITEPVDPKLYPHLQEKSVRVTFRDGRVVDVQRVNL